MKSLITSMMAGGLLAALAMGQPRYAITDLGTLPGGKFSQAAALNDNRLAAGIVSAASGTQYAALWGGPFRINLGTTGLNSGAFGVNNPGQASIQTETSEKDPNNENFCAYGTGLKCVAAIWQRGILTVLPTLGGNNTDPGARIAMQKRVTNAFLFTFATDVTSTQREIIQGEYQFNKRWSASVTRDENGGFAVDGKYRKRY